MESCLIWMYIPVMIRHYEGIYMCTQNNIIYAGDTGHMRTMQKATP